MPRSIAQWYVAKVQYRTVEKIKRFLETNGAECYVAMRDERQLLPGILFIRTDYNHALSLSEAVGGKITYLRDSASGRFQAMSDKAMTDFMFLQDFADKTILLPHPEKLQGGEKVRIIRGEFAGIEGEIYRIKGHKRVIVRLGNLFSLATAYVPREFLEKII